MSGGLAPQRMCFIHQCIDLVLSQLRCVHIVGQRKDAARDGSAALPPYTEEIIAVEMDPPLREAYQKLEDDISAALREHHGNSSVISTAMNALLLYPTNLTGWARFTVTKPTRTASG